MLPISYLGVDIAQTQFDVHLAYLRIPLSNRARIEPEGNIDAETIV